MGVAPGAGPSPGAGPGGRLGAGVAIDWASVVEGVDSDRAKQVLLTKPKTPAKPARKNLRRFRTARRGGKSGEE